MRYSEGTKRYYDDTKKRIFDEIIAAVEAEKTAGISQTENVTSIIEDQKKEGITMKNTTMENTNERVKIRSSKGGLVAAACAVLVVGGGLFAAGHMNGGVSAAPGSAGTSLTTDAEDVLPDEENEEPIEDDPEVFDKDFEELVEASDFIAEVQVLSSRIETGDYIEYTCTMTDEQGNSGTVFKYTGDEVLPETGDYIEYTCTMTDEQGNSGTVFKYTGDEVLPETLRIMQPVTAVTKRLEEGEKVLVFAKNGMQSESDVLSFWLTDASGILKYDMEMERYINVNAPGDYSADPIVFGPFEKDFDSYFKEILFETTEDGFFGEVINWWDYNGINWRVVENDDMAADNLKIYWQGNDRFDIAVVEVPSAEAFEQVSEDVVTDVVTAVEINGDGGRIIEGFEGYNMELAGAIFDTADGKDGIIGVIISVSNADGTPFPEGFLEENSMDLVYGDLTPFMSALNAEEVNMGTVGMSEDNMSVNMALYTTRSVDLSEIHAAGEITIQVNTIVVNGETASEGLFEAVVGFVGGASIESDNEEIGFVDESEYGLTITPRK